MRWTATTSPSGQAPAARCAPRRGQSAPPGPPPPFPPARNGAPFAQVCCSESRPAWLVVSLGAVRQLAALELVYDQDMTYTLSLGNASDGPFLQVGSRVCERCMMNVNVVDEGAFRRQTFKFVPTAAAFVRLAITWSSAGGIGGCADLCDWATNIYDFKAYSPGRMEDRTALATEPEPHALLSAEQPSGACATDADAPLVSSSDMERSIMLTGDAVRLPEGSGMRGASTVVLTPPEPQRFGAVEYSRIVQSGGSCLCDQMLGYIRVTVYVWLGGSASMPGEGLVISLVDADKQTPGKTVFKRGCGTRPALPESAVSIVLDTSDSNPSCDEPGTGARMVASLEGADAPFVLCSTLSMSTAGFRTGSWVPIQFEILDSERWHRPEIESSGVHTTSQKEFVIGNVWVNGSSTLSPYAMLSAYGPLMRAANVTLKRFYIVVSARTGVAGDMAPSDRHAVSAVRVECPTPNTLTLENWDGFRQPFTPPPASPPWQPFVPPPPQPPQALQQLTVVTSFGGLSFVVAFACTLAFFLLAGAMLLLRRSDPENKHVALEIITASKSDKAWLPPAPPAIQLASAMTTGCHVFLSYLRTDARLGDSLHDKLRLAGLHVFKDNFLAGQQLDAELICIMRATPVFAPLMTLSCLQQLSTAATMQQSDPILALLLVAFCLRENGELRLIHPLLVGAASEDGWTSILDDPAYGSALAALPDAIPAATTAVVASALRRAGAPPMPPHIAALTVREVLLGRAASQQEGRLAVAGVLSGAPFVLACSQHHLGLYVSHQFVPPIWETVSKLAD